MNTVVAYVPVIHAGYLNFFRKNGEGGTLLIPDESITSQIEYLWRDMRALRPEEIIPAIGSLGIFGDIWTANIEVIATESLRNPIIMPEEDISRKIAEQLPKGANVTYDPVFLRWDSWNVHGEEAVFWDREMDEFEFYSSVLETALTEQKMVSDWWRQIAAVAFYGKDILLAAHNHHLPTELEPYYSGDPRTVFKAGEFIDYSSSIHAEAALVAEAAKRGINLSGKDVFVTTYPCPPCANLLSQTGIKRLYVADGYSKLGAKEIFAKAGIEVVRVIKTPI
jgi:dCMP deaminase